jgi:phospholipase/carboxylesterase
MTMQANISALETLEITHSDRIDYSVIWLHGLGADGHDFAPVVYELNLPHTRFVLPHAPERPVALNNGYVMPAWYDIFGLDSGSRQDAHGIGQSQLQIEALIAQEEASGVAPEHIVLAGFSQGGAIALHTALRYPKPLGGLIVLSGYLPLKTQLDQEASDANRHLPIFMAHGSFDQVITPDIGKASAILLEQHGYEVQWHEYAMAHSVCTEEITDIRAFLCTLFDIDMSAEVQASFPGFPPSQNS